MLNDWLPKQATSSLGMSPSRAPLPVAPVRPAHAPGNTSRGVSVPEVHGEPQLVRKPSDWMASNQVDSRLEFYRVDLRRQRPLRQDVAHRPRLGASIR